MEFEIFKGKKFSELCKDIYVNQFTRKEQIEVMIADLRPLIKGVSDAMVVVPLIKGYLDTGNTNDDHLVKLASIIQKIMTATTEISGEGGLLISDEEKKQIMAQIESQKEEAANLIESNNTIQPTLDKLKKETIEKKKTL
jgi:hypothetical protein